MISIYGRQNLALQLISSLAQGRIGDHMMDESYQGLRIAHDPALHDYVRNIFSQQFKMSRQYYAYVLHRQQVEKVTDLLVEVGYAYGKQYQRLAKIYGRGYEVTTIPIESSKVWQSIAQRLKDKGLIIGNRSFTYLLNVPISKGQSIDDIMVTYRSQVRAAIGIMSESSSIPETPTMDSISSLKQMLNHKDMDLDPEIRKKMEARHQVWNEIKSLSKAYQDSSTLKMTFNKSLSLFKDDVWVSLIKRMMDLWPEEAILFKSKKNLHNLHLWLQKVMLLPPGILSHQDGQIPIRILAFDITKWPGNDHSQHIPVSWASL